MKKIIVLLSLAFFVKWADAQDLNSIFQGWKEVYFSFQAGDRAELDKLSSLISLDKVEGNTAYAYANEKEFLNFLERGKSFQILPHPGNSLKNPHMVSHIDIKGTNDWDFYPTYEAYIDIMNQFQADYPDICQVYSIGQSVQGRELMVAHITDNPDQVEAEPQVFYTSTMHGDETTGYILALHLIDYLLFNYGSSPRITAMIDNMDIYINPLANPDGTYAGGNNTVNGATRYNANGVDPNRNFPDPVAGDHPDGEAWQLETLAMMDFANNHHFTISTNWHGGAEVFNYPWDTKYELHPDDDWWIYTGRQWADTVHLHSNTGYFTDLNDGITNGAAWYIVQGGRQDYMNYFHHCREVTIELSAEKLPPANQMPYFWEAQYRSMLNHIEQANYGIRGTVTDTDGNPVEAKIFIDAHDADGSWVMSSSVHGDYYRPIKAGTYTVTVSAPCYDTQTFTDVNVQDMQATILNVSLTGNGFSADFEASDTNIQIGGSVDFTSLSCGNPTSYSWTFEGGTPSTSTDENPTVIYNSAGTFSVSLTISDGTNNSTTTKEDYITASAIYTMENTTVTTCQGLFYDSGGDEGNYSNDEDYTMTFLPATTGGAIQVDFISFNVEEETDCSYDYLTIYDGENTSATSIGTYCGSNSPGTVIATNEAGALTFVFHSDYSISQSGWEASVSCAGVAPSADFTADDVTILPGGTVHFSDASLYSPTSWSWIFPGGNPGSSTEQNPSVTYPESGTYNVTLTVSNENGSSTVVKDDYINVDTSNGIELATHPQARIYPNPTHGIIQIDLEDDEIALWEVIDQTGNIVLQQVPQSVNKLDMSGLPKGIYVVRAYAAKEMYVYRVSLLK